MPFLPSRPREVLDIRSPDPYHLYMASQTKIKLLADGDTFMARKHDNGSDASDATANAVYVLDKDRWEPVLSRIYTMNLKTSEGAVEVEKTRLVSQDDKKNDVYRYQRRVAVPSINEKAITDADSLAAEVLAFARNIEAYDNASQLSNEGIKKPDAETKLIDRPIRVSVNSKGEPISAIEYVRKLLVDANTLAIQKQLQKDLRDRAETELMDELGLQAPSGKVRVAKTATDSDASAAFDTL